MRLNSLRKNQRGFTAVEMALFIVILVVIAGVGAYVARSAGNANQTLDTVNNSSSSQTNASGIKKLSIKQWNVAFTYKVKTFKKLTYTFDTANDKIVFVSPLNNTVPASCGTEGAWGVSRYPVDKVPLPDGSGYMAVADLKGNDNFIVLGKYAFKRDYPQTGACTGADSDKAAAVDKDYKEMFSGQK